METINIDVRLRFFDGSWTCNDIKALKAYARELESENRRLKSAYMLLSSRFALFPGVSEQDVASDAAPEGGTGQL